MNTNAYTTIASMDGQEKYKLIALMEPDGSYCMASFSFTDENGHENYYDNPSYIFGDEFYEVFKLWVTKKKVENGEYFSEIVKDIPLEDFPTIYEMLEEGIKLKFNEEI